MSKNVKVLIEIPKAEYELIVGDEACGLNPLTRAIANGSEIDDKVYAELIDKEYHYINEQEDLGMELLNALAKNKALKEAIEKMRAEIDNLERLELKGEKTPLINGDNVLQIIDKYKVESENEE